MIQYGDRHNFGRSVHPVGKHWIAKPRTTFWEELFLSEDSRWRDYLEIILGGEPMMECLPRLQYRSQNSLKPGKLVERLEVRPPEPSQLDTAYVLEAFGGLIALGSWFGLDDLHFGNLFFGHNKKDGKLVLTPTDIELVFKNIVSPAELALLPHLTDHRNASGINILKPFIFKRTPKESLAVAYGYLRITERLLSHSKEIINLLNRQKNILNAPIRVLIRNTAEYTSTSTKNWMPEERLQLERNEIPYFFCTLSDKKIRYYSSQDLRRSKPIQNQSSARKLTTPIVRPDKLFSSPERIEFLSEHAVVMLGSYFVRSAFKGELQYRNLSASVSSKNMKIQYGDSTLIGPRNWGEFVQPLRF